MDVQGKMLVVLGHIRACMIRGVIRGARPDRVSGTMIQGADSIEGDISIGGALSIGTFST